MDDNIKNIRDIILLYANEEQIGNIKTGKVSYTIFSCKCCNELNHQIDFEKYGILQILQYLNSYDNHYEEKHPFERSVIQNKYGKIKAVLEK